MGLNHPEDLEAFRRDELARQSFRRLRALKRRFAAPSGPPPTRLRRLGAEPDVVMAVDSMTLSCRASVLGVLGPLDPERVAILAPFELDDEAVGFAAHGPDVEGIESIDDLARAVPSVRSVLSAGYHAPAGRLVHDLMMRQGGASIVVQHGMLLPQAAPLPSGAILAAWSDADAAFWRSGRHDIETHTIGAELLRRARVAQVRVPPVDERPVYCGALHGTELPRAEIERVARSFCRATGARYRPHPAETDLQSRLTHLVWSRIGIEFAPADRPLLDVDAPIVGMWSTGILEAAAAGLPAWVYHPDPPEWLAEVWSRYGMAEWGAEPTPVPAIAEGEPSDRLAALIGDTLR